MMVQAYQGSGLKSGRRTSLYAVTPRSVVVRHSLVVQWLLLLSEGRRRIVPVLSLRVEETRIHLRLLRRRLLGVGVYTGRHCLLQERLLGLCHPCHLLGVGSSRDV